LELGICVVLFRDNMLVCKGRREGGRARKEGNYTFVGVGDWLDVGFLLLEELAFAVDEVARGVVLVLLFTDVTDVRGGLGTGVEVGSRWVVGGEPVQAGQGRQVTVTVMSFWRSSRGL
jgi:hypothetical protein